MGELLAVAIAANIVQLVDGAFKAFNICHQIYSLGASIDDTRIINTSEELNQAYSVLTNSLNQNAAPPGNKNHHLDVQLRELAHRCIDTTKELINELQKVKKPPRGNFRKTLSIALRKKLKAKKLEQLKRSLDEYQQALDSKVLVDIREWLGRSRAERRGDTSILKQQLATISADLNTCHTSVSTQLKTEIEKNITNNKEQHVMTRRRVESETDRAVSTNETQHAMTRQHAESQVVSAMQDLELSHDRQRIAQSEAQELQRQYDQFLKSFWFDDINLRMNEVSESHSGTFQWMFDDTLARPWSSFTEWLTGKDSLYFVQGKAGSGKSTLMKFIADHSRTMELLQQWSSKDNVLIVKLYFWLSGSKLQRSLKGLLCSLLRQIMLEERRVFDMIDKDEILLSKRNINDWSVRELQDLLMQSINLLTEPVCIFIDGLDEYDQEDDVDNLLNLVESLSSLSTVKICVSSRPEHYIMTRMSNYSQVRLQDLTAADIKKYIYDKLRAALTDRSPAVLDGERLDDVVRRMTNKAEGVFLWVQFALGSLINSMRSADDFEELLEGIEKLPRGMNQLYTQMWNRLNENQQRYRDEATIYFSYECFYPLSIFEMLVATDSNLQSRYLDSFRSQNKADLASRCERLATRINTRTAGMLEVVYSASVSEYSNSGSEKISVHTKGRSQSVGLAVANKEPPAARHGSDEGLSPKDNLDIYYQSKVNFLHRTARDFLLNSTTGRRIFGRPVNSHEERVENVVRARIAAQLQGLTKLNNSNIEKTIELIGTPGVAHEVELLTVLKRACQHLSLPNQPKRNIAYKEFWYSEVDFQHWAVYHGCSKYIQCFVLQTQMRISPYYRGYLLLSAIGPLLRDKTDKAFRHLSLISWLLSNGADVVTKHVRNFSGDLWQYNPYNAASAILLLMIDPEFWSHSNLAKQVAEILQILLPMIYNSAAKCIVRFNPKAGWSTCSLSTEEIFGEHVAVRMTLAKLCHLVIRRIDFEMPYDPRWSCNNIFDQNHRTELLYFDSAGDDDAEEVVCPSSKDSKYLGKALDDVLFFDPAASLSLDIALQVLNERFVRVSERSPRRNLGVVLFNAGWWFDQRRLSERTLDPSEEVDESNWMVRGYFKRHNKVSTEYINPKTHSNVESESSWETVSEADSEVQSSAIQANGETQATCQKWN